MPATTNPSNVGSQNALIDQGHYVNGVAAGLCTADEPARLRRRHAVRPVLLNVNSFLLGSRQTNPAATRAGVFTGGWEDEAHDAAATNALVDAGCDVIACHLDAPRVVIETAERAASRPAATPSTRRRSPPRATSPAPTTTGPRMFETFVETLQRGGTLPNFVTGGYDKDYVRSSPFGAGATLRRSPPPRPPCRQCGTAMQSSSVRSSTTRQARGAGRDRLWPLCRRAPADRLSDPGRDRLDQLTGLATSHRRTYVRPACGLGPSRDSSRNSPPP